MLRRLSYVGRLRSYHQHEVSSSGEYSRHAQESPRDSIGFESFSQSEASPLGSEHQPSRLEWLEGPSPIGRTQTPIGHPIDEGDSVAPTPPERAVPASFVRRYHADCGGVAGDE